VNDDLAELHVYAGPDNPLEAAAISWLVTNDKEPQRVEWCDGRQQWQWWREWCDVTRHTLPDALYRYLRPSPGQKYSYSYSWCAFLSYQEAIAAFVAAYAAWLRLSGGVNEPGKGV
jgi:hypothetical protein